jgi:hypothetical protein
MTQISNTSYQQSLVAAPISANATDALLFATPNNVQTVLPPASNAKGLFRPRTPNKNSTVSRATFSLAFFAFAVSFAPLAANARGPLPPSTQPSLQLIQISGPTNPSPFGVGRAGDLPGHKSGITGGAAIYALRDVNDIQDAAVSLSDLDH